MLPRKLTYRNKHNIYTKMFQDPNYIYVYIWKNPLLPHTFLGTKDTGKKKKKKKGTHTTYKAKRGAKFLWACRVEQGERKAELVLANTHQSMTFCLSMILHSLDSCHSSSSTVLRFFQQTSNLNSNCVCDFRRKIE